MLVVQFKFGFGFGISEWKWIWIWCRLCKLSLDSNLQLGFGFRDRVWIRFFLLSVGILILVRIGKQLICPTPFWFPIAPEKKTTNLTYPISAPNLPREEINRFPLPHFGSQSPPKGKQQIDPTIFWFPIAPQKKTTHLQYQILVPSSSRSCGLKPFLFQGGSMRIVSFALRGFVFETRRAVCCFGFRCGSL